MTEQGGKRSEELAFDTGSMTREQIELIFSRLPVDITFVGMEDEVKYFSKPGERTFTRPKSVIGKKVQMCHPQKSLHVVQKILDEFKANKRDFAEFWIDLKGRFIYIRYFALRNAQGEYQGTLEVVQDATRIRELQGEKRLLD